MVALRNGKPTRFMESEESQFHRLLADSPKDNVNRLVYADWLQDNKRDSEAELMRHSTKKQNEHSLFTFHHVKPYNHKYGKYFNVDRGYNGYQIHAVFPGEHGSDLGFAIRSNGRIGEEDASEMIGNLLKAGFTHADSPGWDSKPQFADDLEYLKKKRPEHFKRSRSVNRLAALTAPNKPTRFANQEDHQAFLNHLADNPNDLTSHLVYADWLEENGKPVTASLIRKYMLHDRDLADRGERKWKSAIQKHYAEGGLKIPGRFAAFVHKLNPDIFEGDFDHNKPFFIHLRTNLPHDPDSSLAESTASLRWEPHYGHELGMTKEEAQSTLKALREEQTTMGNPTALEMATDAKPGRYGGHWKREGKPNKLASLTTPNNPQTLTIKVPTPVPVTPKRKPQQVQQPQPRQAKLKGGIKTTPAPAYTVLPFSFGSDNRKNKRDGKATKFELDETGFHKHIAEDPSDHLRWHVYADALQDAGRDREAEMIRCLLKYNPIIGGKDQTGPPKKEIFFDRFPKDSDQHTISIYLPQEHHSKDFQPISYFRLLAHRVPSEDAAKIVGHGLRSGYSGHPINIDTLKKLTEEHPEHFRKGIPYRFAEEDHIPSQEESFLDHLSRNKHYADPTLLGAYADWMEEHEPHREAEIKMLRRAFIKHISGDDDNNDYVLSGVSGVDYPNGSISLYRKGYSQDGPIEVLSYYHPSGVHKMHIEGPDEESIAKLAGNLVQNGAKTAPRFEYHKQLLNELQQKYPQHFQTEETAQKYRRGKPSRFAEDYQAERPDAHYKVMKKVIPNFDKSFRVMQKANPQGLATPVKPDSDLAKHYTRYGHNLIGLHDEKGNLRQLGLLHRDPNQQYADNGEHGQAKEGVKMTLIGHHDDSERASQHLSSYLNGFSGYDQLPDEKKSNSLSLLHEAGNIAREKGDLSYFPGIDHLKETGFKFDNEEQNYYQTPKNIPQMDRFDQMTHKSIHANVGLIRRRASEMGKVQHGFHHDMTGNKYFTIAHPDGRTVTRSVPSFSNQSSAEELGYHHAYDPKERLGHEGKKFDKARMLMQLEHAEKTGNLHFPRYEQPKEKMKRGQPTRMMGIGCFSSPGPTNTTFPSYDGKKKKKKKEPEKFGEEFEDEEAGFHRHLEGNFHDRTAWLVYADWLEEHGREAEGKAIRLRMLPDEDGDPSASFRIIPAWEGFQDQFELNYNPIRRKKDTQWGQLKKINPWARVFIYRRMKHDPTKVLSIASYPPKMGQFREIAQGLRNSDMQDNTEDWTSQEIDKGLNLKKEQMRRGVPQRFSEDIESEEAQFHRAIDNDRKLAPSIYADYLEDHDKSSIAKVIREYKDVPLIKHPQYPALKKWYPGEWYYTPSVAVEGGTLRLIPFHKPDHYFQWPVHAISGHDLEGIKNEVDAVWENGRLEKKGE